MSDAAGVLRRADELGAISEAPELLVRPYGSDALRRANELVGGWMTDAGMDVAEDAVGNLVGRLEGGGDGTLLLGSHLDTVRNAGRYDGPLGVLAAIACVERLRRAAAVRGRGRRLRRRGGAALRDGVPRLRGRSRGASSRECSSCETARA